MSILGDRIKKERENLNLAREDLAKKIGVSYSAIAMYEQGNREPNNELLLKMCEIFNCSIDYLMGNSEFKTNSAELNAYLDVYHNSLFFKAIFETRNLFKDIPITIEDLQKISDIISKCALEKEINDANTIITKYLYMYIQKGRTDEEKFKITTALSKFIENSTSKFYEECNNLDEKEKHIHMCPVYGRISAGQPNWAEECIEGRIPIDPNMMNIVNPEECYFLRVNGESMNKKVKNGAFALIQKTDYVENGEIAVVLVNGYDATLKKFSKQGDLIILEPMSTDPSFTAQVYDKNTEVKVIGKYLGKMEME